MTFNLNSSFNPVENKWIKNLKALHNIYLLNTQRKSLKFQASSWKLKKH